MNVDTCADCGDFINSGHLTFCDICFAPLCDGCGEMIPEQDGTEQLHCASCAESHRQSVDGSADGYIPGDE